MIAQSKLQGTLLLNESLARYNSWRVGGKADRVYIPAGLQDLQAFLQGWLRCGPLHAGLVVAALVELCVTAQQIRCTQHHAKPPRRLATSPLR